MDTYRSTGGYQALKKALGMTPHDVIAEVKAAGLRGRGGAGFPTGQKWSFVPQDTGKPTYLVCNFDESEPGTFNNRELVERDPHQLLEGIAIASYAIQCHTAYVYCRGEFLWPGTVLERAIAEAYDKGLLGKGIAGSDFDLDVVVHRGAGAYICGEETALLESLEGYRGQPRMRPPFPAIEGLYSSPTAINNVETLCNVPHIIEKGASWFAGIGTEKSTGTKLFSVSGKVNRPGNYELPMGTPAEVLINDLGDGIVDGRALKAWTPGGSSTPFLTDQHLGVGLDFESIQAAGSLLGTGAVIVLDETDCIVDAAMRLTQFYAHESCGKCTPCREGTWWMTKVYNRLENGLGRKEDLPLLQSVSDNILFKAFCALADGAVSPVASSLKHFYAEYEAHVTGAGCPFKHSGALAAVGGREAPPEDSIPATEVIP
ncbi:MAG: NADH-quinone oxidoreductase subunit NuoF [Actinobacteria bacterium]|nr:NADH-quinone oxidoreductase subunit NuoF [Actinomycetota bacterium]